MQYDPKNYSDSNPFLIIELQNNADAIKLIRRSILVKQIVELWACEQTPDKLKESIQKTGFTERDVYKTSSFKFLVDSFGNSLSIGDQIKKMNTFAWMGFKGLVDLNDPDVCFAYYEDYSGETYAGKKRTNPPSRLFFGVLLATGNRSIVAQYDLKKRDYLGTTSMDAELSLIMANQALAGPGSIVLDPFVGTGSFLVSCSHFGAYTIGADIDGRQIRGADGRGIENNLTQYKLDNLVLGTLVCDIAHHPWRSGEWFDAIVCDPPYGVRAGAKKIASTNRSAYKKFGLY
jgi:tRNA (guanine10-N2)-methyltransferase